MKINFKNKHIFFATESIWKNLDYKFKYKLNELVKLNSDDEFIQELNIDENVLIQIFSAVTVEPEGVSASINKEMQNELIPQIEALSNLNDATTDPNFAANEAGRILIAIGDIQKANQSIRDEKIIKGKTQILK